MISIGITIWWAAAKSLFNFMSYGSGWRRNCVLWGRVYFLVEARTLMMAAGVSHAVYSDDVDIADVEAFSLSGRFAKEIGLSPSIVEL